MVYISVQMLYMLQTSIWASEGSFQELHHSCLFESLLAPLGPCGFMAISSTNNSTPRQILRQIFKNSGQKMANLLHKATYVVILDHNASVLSRICQAMSCWLTI